MVTLLGNPDKSTSPFSSMSPPKACQMLPEPHVSKMTLQQKTPLSPWLDVYKTFLHTSLQLQLPSILMTSMMMISTSLIHHSLPKHLHSPLPSFNNGMKFTMTFFIWLMRLVSWLWAPMKNWLPPCLQYPMLLTAIFLQTTMTQKQSQPFYPNWTTCTTGLSSLSTCSVPWPHVPQLQWLHQLTMTMSATTTTMTNMTTVNAITIATTMTMQMVIEALPYARVWCNDG